MSRINFLDGQDYTHTPAPQLLPIAPPTRPHWRTKRAPSAPAPPPALVPFPLPPQKPKPKASSATFVASALAATNLFAVTNAPDSNHSAYSVVDPTTGNTLEYRDLVKGNESELWQKAWCREYERLGPEGTCTMHPIHHSDKPIDRTAGYMRLVAAKKPHKEEKERIRFTCAHRQHDYPGVVTTPTVDITTVKCHLNSVVSTPDAEYMCIDISDFYLNTLMERCEYMRIPVNLIPAAIMEKYSLAQYIHNGYILYKIFKGLYGLAQAGRLANDKLIIHLAAAGYHQSPNTPGLFTHETFPLSFTLCVDDFGIKYTNREHAKHLIRTLQEHYRITIDWSGKQYLGLTLDWDYKTRTVDISMPGYVERSLHRFQHKSPSRPQHSPHAWTAPQYGAPTQLTDEADLSPKLNADGITFLQQLIGTLLYYARAVDNTMLVAIGTLSAAQAHGTEATMESAIQLLNYCATHPDAIVRYHASDMILHIHSDASYLSVTEARSRLGGYFFLSSTPTTTTPDPKSAPPPFNGPVLVNSSIMRNVVSSAAEAELGALFHNAKDGAMLRTTLHDMGHPQPATPLQTDNACAAGIANDTVRQRRSKAMDMRFYWIRDRVRLGEFTVFWRSGAENDADYFTKHHPPTHHRLQRSRYLHVAAHSSCLPRGCVDLAPEPAEPATQFVRQPGIETPSSDAQTDVHHDHRFTTRQYAYDSS